MGSSCTKQTGTPTSSSDSPSEKTPTTPLNNRKGELRAVGSCGGSLTASDSDALKVAASPKNGGKTNNNKGRFVSTISRDLCYHEKLLLQADSLSPSPVHGEGGEPISPVSCLAQKQHQKGQRSPKVGNTVSFDTKVQPPTPSHPPIHHHHHHHHHGYGHNAVCTRNDECPMNANDLLNLEDAPFVTSECSNSIFSGQASPARRRSVCAGSSIEGSGSNPARLAAPKLLSIDGAQFLRSEDSNLLTVRNSQSGDTGNEEGDSRKQSMQLAGSGASATSASGGLHNCQPLADSRSHSSNSLTVSPVVNSVRVGSPLAVCAVLDNSTTSEGSNGEAPQVCTTALPTPCTSAANYPMNQGLRLSASADTNNAATYTTTIPNHAFDPPSTLVLANISARAEATDNSTGSIFSPPAGGASPPSVAKTNVHCDDDSPFSVGQPHTPQGRGGHDDTVSEDAPSTSDNQPVVLSYSTFLGTATPQEFDGSPLVLPSPSATSRADDRQFSLSRSPPQQALAVRSANQ